jgi:hypothetical protein
MPGNGGSGASREPSWFDFNKELVCGECGALVAANGSAWLAARFTPSPSWISGTAVVGTLAGGSLFWLAARIYDRSRGRRYAKGELASDLGYFTPAAIGLGLAVYDPLLYATSRYLLCQDARVLWAVTAGQGVAFSWFAAAMNLYRLGLRRFSGTRL